MSPGRWRASLGLRIALTAGLSGLAAGLLALAYVDVASTRQEKARLEETSRGILNAAAPLAAAACFTGDPVLAQQVVDQLVGTAGVRSATLSASGAALAQAARPGPGPDLRYALDLRSPFNPEQVVGELALGMDPAVIARQSARTLALFRGALAAALAGLGAALAAALHRIVRVPLRALCEAVRTLDGQPDSRLAPALTRPRHELGELGRELDGAIIRLGGVLDQGRARADRLAAAERKLQAILDQADAGIFVLRGDGALDLGTPAFLRRLGLDQADAGTPLARLFGPEAGQAQACLDQCRAGEGAASALLRAPGDRGWQRLTLKPVGPDWIQGQLEDLETGPADHPATLDPLTGALNRLGAERAIAGHLADDLTGPALLQVGLDLDPDLCARREALTRGLQAAVARMAGALGPLDRVARLEGQEFLLILGELEDPGPAGAIRRQVLAALEGLPGLGAARAGLALRDPEEEPSVPVLMARAEAALARESRAPDRSPA